MSARPLLWSIFAACVGGLALAATDALITTDEEKVEDFLATVTEASPARRVEAALGYADPGREPVELLLRDARESYSGGDERVLSERAHDALAALDAGSLELLQDAVEIDHDRALVAIRAQTRDGIVDVQFRLRRHEDHWLLSRVRVL